MGSPLIGIVYRYNQDPMVRHACVNADYIEVQLVDLFTYHSSWLSKPIKVGLENYFSPHSESEENDYLAKSTDFVTDCYKPGQIINLVEISNDKEYGLRVYAGIYFYDFNEDGYMDIAIHQFFMRGRKKREKPDKSLMYENFTFHSRRIMKMVYSPQIKRFLNPVQEKSPLYPQHKKYKTFNLKDWMGKR
jgi:hypothetical protein